jgi:hypothetical protein
MNTGWMATLDAFERHMDLQVTLVEQGRYDEVVAFDPPPGLPALPAVLVARASELVSRAQALTRRAGSIRDDTARRLAGTRHQAFVQHHVPVYFDQLA